MKFITFVFVATILIACGKNQPEGGQPVGQPTEPPAGQKGAQPGQDPIDPLSYLGVWKRSAISEDGVNKVAFDPAFVNIVQTKFEIAERNRMSWESTSYRVEANKFVVKSEKGKEYGFEFSFDVKAQTLELKYSSNGPDGGKAIVDRYVRATEADRGKYPAVIK